MILTQDQIQQLNKFTRAHYVEHYDLQTELVGHLANGICLIFFVYLCNIFCFTLKSRKIVRRNLSRIQNNLIL